MERKQFIGVDEAGYGPNLGPLLICASVWTAPAAETETSFREKLSKTFVAKPWKLGCDHVPLGDSKLLYQPGHGVSSLEAGLLSLVKISRKLNKTKPNLASQSLQSVLELIELVAHTPPKSETQYLPWYHDLDALAIPNAIEESEISLLSTRALQALKTHDIELNEVRAVIVNECYFNNRIEQLGSKGLLLSQTTLTLVADLLAAYDQFPSEVYCDRQGGRKNYMPILLDAMPDAWFYETLSSNQRCSYRSNAQTPCDVHFTVRGDQFPPTALASMLAKYLRERIMEAFNNFWASHTPDLRPTAGYPVDAARFLKDVEATAQTLGLPQDAWWRVK